MQRYGVILPDRLKIVVRWSASTHVVFGVDLKETEIGTVAQYLLIVLRLEANACPGRNCRDRHHVQAGRLMGSREPLPSGVSMLTQLPFGTSFQELPW